MGFRSTFTTEDYAIDWPDWFIEKYSGLIGGKTSGTLSSMYESKTYWGPLESLPKDIQRAIDWDDFGVGNFVIVYLHECGGITRCQISRGAILWSEPTEWRVTDGVWHSGGCYGCSDVPEGGGER